MFQSNMAKRFGDLVKEQPLILHRPFSLYCQTTIMWDQVTASTQYSLWPIYLLAELNTIDEGRIVLNLNFFPYDIFSLIHVSTVRRKNSSCNFRSYYLYKTCNYFSKNSWKPKPELDKQNINKSPAVQATKREISYWEVLGSLKCDKFYL